MDSSLARRGKQQASSFKLDKYQAPGYNGRQKEEVNMKQELKKINDELMEFYNKPSMALHFQPTNLKVLRGLITRLVLLEKEDEKENR
jgi:hypothetical protein